MGNDGKCGCTGCTGTASFKELIFVIEPENYRKNREKNPLHNLIF